MVLWQECQLISEEKEKLGFGFKLKIFFRYGVTDWNFYNKKDISKIITTFQAMYYGEKRSELSAEISDIEEYLNNVNKDLLSNYLDFSEPQALEKLNSLKNIRIKMYDTNSAKNGFHTKGYIFKEEEVYRIIIGSSNMTSAALTTNREWNTKLVSTSQGEVAEDILKEFDELWNSEYALDYDVFYEEYKQRYEIIKEQRKIATERNVTSLERYKLKPNSMQVRFITNLKNILQKDEKRALLISATGTGKTYASAFAMRELGFKRVLFIVHRASLAVQAKKSYQRVFANSVSMGLVGAGYYEYDKDYVFATVETLNKDAHLQQYKVDDFDCIILDEAHHSSANTYQKVMNYFMPRLFLGMTATPDKRTDSDDNIYEIFNHQIIMVS